MLKESLSELNFIDGRKSLNCRPLHHNIMKHRRHPIPHPQASNACGACAPMASLLQYRPQHLSILPESLGWHFLEK